MYFHARVILTNIKWKFRLAYMQNKRKVLWVDLLFVISSRIETHKTNQFSSAAPTGPSITILNKSFC